MHISLKEWYVRLTLNGASYADGPQAKTLLLTLESLLDGGHGDTKVYLFDTGGKSADGKLFQQGCKFADVDKARLFTATYQAIERRN